MFLFARAAQTYAITPKNLAANSNSEDLSEQRNGSDSVVSLGSLSCLSKSNEDGVGMIIAACDSAQRMGLSTSRSANASWSVRKRPVNQHPSIWRRAVTIQRSKDESLTNQPRVSRDLLEFSPRGAVRGEARRVSAVGTFNRIE